jgi:hypothetical protein
MSNFLKNSCLLNFNECDFDYVLNKKLFFRLEARLNKISLIPQSYTLNILSRPNRNNIQYWARIGASVDVAVLFSYPIAKFLFGNQMKWKLAIGENHTSLIGVSILTGKNHKLFIDPICFVYNFDMVRLYGDKIKYVEEKDFSQWYFINILGGIYDPILDDIEKLASY